MTLRFNRRSYKRRVNRLFKKLKRGSYFIDCNYHVCKVTDKQYYGIDGGVDGISIFDSQGTSCSLLHCSPVPITKEKAKEMLEFVKNNTWEDYLKKYIGYTDEELVENRKMDEAWNFRKTGEMLNVT